MAQPDQCCRRGTTDTEGCQRSHRTNHGERQREGEMRHYHEVATATHQHDECQNRAEGADEYPEPRAPLSQRHATSLIRASPFQCSSAVRHASSPERATSLPRQPHARDHSRGRRASTSTVDTSAGLRWKA